MADLGFTNVLTDFTLKPKNMEGWIAPTSENENWLIPLIQKARFEIPFHESNLSCKIYDLRICEGDFDNHHGVWTRSQMVRRCHEHVSLLSNHFENRLYVYQTMIHKETGSYKIRFIYAGTLIGQPGREEEGRARIEVLETIIRQKLNIQENENFELLMRGKPGKNRTRVFSAQHDIYNGDLSEKAICKYDLTRFYQEAQDWLSEPGHEDLSGLLTIKEAKPTFHRSSSRNGRSSTERSVFDSIEDAPVDFHYGAGTRFDSLPSVCAYICRSGYKNNEPAAWEIYKQLDTGSKDMLEDPKRAKRDFLSCIRKTNTVPIERTGDYEVQTPEKLLFDDGSYFKNKFSKQEIQILTEIAATRLHGKFKSQGNLSRNLKALPKAFELIFSKIGWEEAFPVVDRKDFLQGSVTLNFGGREKEIPEFKWVDSKLIFEAVSYACLSCSINPETGREYNYLRDRHARCYTYIGSVEQCLKRHLRLSGKSMKILEFKSLNEYKLILDSELIIPDSISDQNTHTPLLFNSNKTLLIEEITSKSVHRLNDLLKQGSFNLKDRITEVQEVVEVLNSVDFYDRYKLLRMFKLGCSLPELINVSNKMRKKRNFQYSNKTG